MKALTVKQPLATGIARGWKPIENRTRLTKHRGELAIHAGLAWHKEWGQHPAMRKAWSDWAATVPLRPIPGVETGYPGGLHDGPHLWIPRCAIIAVVDVEGCHPARLVDQGDGTTWWCCGPWGVGGWHWELANVRLLANEVPTQRGYLGLWNVPADVEAAVQAEMR